MQDFNFLDRPPRVQPLLPVDQVEIPAPPGKENQLIRSLVEVFLPILTIGGYLVMAMSGAGRSMALMLPMGLAMFGSVYIALRQRRISSEEAKAAAAAYQQRLTDLRQKMHHDHDQQRDFYYYNYPSPTAAASIATQKNLSRSGPRIWERRTSNSDFGAVRLGIATRPSSVTYTLHNALDESPLALAAMRLMRESQWLTDVPITIQLCNTRRDEDEIDVGVRHSVGIQLSLPNIQGRTSRPATDLTQRYDHLYAHVRALLIHYTTFHSPQDAKLYIVGAKTNKIRWEWARALPHTHAGQNRNEDLLCFDDEEVRGVDGDYVPRIPPFLKDLLVLLQTRQQRLSEKELVDVTLPFILVVVDTVGADTELMNNIQTDSAISLILRSGRQLGCAVIFLADKGSKIPSDVQTIIELEEDTQSRVAFRYAESGLNSRRIIGQADLFSSAAEAETIAIQLSKYEVRVGAAASLASLSICCN